MFCKKCNKELTPARAFWDGEPTYVGFIPCPCDKRISTDYGIVYPGTEEHKMIIQSGRYSINDILN